MSRGAVVAGALGLVLGALAWPGRGVLVARQDAYADAAFWTLLAAAALSLLPGRLPRLAALPVLLAGGVLLATAAHAALGTGLPDPAVGILVAGGVVVGVAVVVRAVREPRGSWRRGTLEALVAVLVVAGLAVGLDAAAWQLPVVSRTAAPGGPPPPVVGRPETVRWTWRDTVAADTVLPAGQGVVVAKQDGVVVGLDGRSGTPRWAVGRTGSRAAVSTTPDRRHVVVVQTAGRGRDDEGGAGPRLRVLDADTGATRLEERGGGFAALADGVLVTGGGGPQVVARSLDDARPLWSAPAPAGCWSGASGVVAARVVAVLWSCTGAASVQAYDAATGAPRWRLASTDLGPQRVIGAGLATPPDGTVLAFAGDLEQTDQRFAVLLDPDTGRVLARHDGLRARLSVGSRPVLRASDATVTGPDTAVTPTGPVPLPATPCAVESTLAVAATPDATVRVCSGVTLRLPLLQVDDRAPEPLPIDPGRYRDVTDGDEVPGRPEAFAVPAPGAFVLGVRQDRGSTLVGYGP